MKKNYAIINVMKLDKYAYAILYIYLKNICETVRIDLCVRIMCIICLLSSLICYIYDVECNLFIKKELSLAKWRCIIYEWKQDNADFFFFFWQNVFLTR